MRAFPAIATGLALSCFACGGEDDVASDAGRDTAIPDAVFDSSALDAGADAAADPADAAADSAVVEDAAVPASFRVALSVSPFTEVLLAAGLRFDDGSGAPAATIVDVQRQLVAHGATEVYARVSTERTEVGLGGAHALDSAIVRAALAAELGLPLNPEIGLFGTYGDLSCQTAPSFAEYPAIVPPGPWETLTIDEMIPLIRAFTAEVATALLETGVTVNVWDVGNEVDFGTAGVAVEPLAGTACDIEEDATGWYRAPDGVDPEIGRESVQSLLAIPESERVAWLEAHVWPHVARLLAAAAEGIRSVAPEARIATHVSGVSATPVAALAFYRTMAANGLDLDELGFSYYPSANAGEGRLTSVREMVDLLHSELGKPVFMAELAYPASTIDDGSFATWDVPIAGYPLTNEGQADFLRGLASWGASGALSGMRPWAPDIAVSDWHAFALYEPATGTTMRPRPSLDAIAEGVASPDPGAI